MSFANKVVVVTGASSGIGASIAIMFAKEGANVAIIGRNDKKLESTGQKCGKKGYVIKADISIDAEAREVITKTIDKFGKIDVLVNNAGIGRLGSVLDGNGLSAYDELFVTNVRAVFHMTTLAAPHLIKTKGNIVNISSVLGLAVPADPKFVPYCMSKAALDHFTKGVALELASHGVRVNSVNPGPVRTDIFENFGVKNFSWDTFNSMTPLGRFSEPDEIGDVVLFLAGGKAKGITGSTYVADNGIVLLSNIVPNPKK